MGSRHEALCNPGPYVSRYLVCDRTPELRCASSGLRYYLPTEWKAWCPPLKGSNSSTGAAFRPKTAGKARQMAVYALCDRAAS